MIAIDDELIIWLPLEMILFVFGYICFHQLKLLGGGAVWSLPFLSHPQSYTLVLDGYLIKHPKKKTKSISIIF